MEIDGYTTRFEARYHAGNQVKVCLIDQLTIRLERVPPVSHAIEDGLWLDGFQELIEIRIDQQIDGLHIADRQALQSPCGKARGSREDILAEAQQSPGEVRSDEPTAAKNEDRALQPSNLLFKRGSWILVPSDIGFCR